MEGLVVVRGENATQRKTRNEWRKAIDKVEKKMERKEIIRGGPLGC